MPLRTTWIAAFIVFCVFTFLLLILSSSNQLRTEIAKLEIHIEHLESRNTTTTTVITPQSPGPITTSSAYKSSRQYILESANNFKGFSTGPTDKFTTHHYEYAYGFLLKYLFGSPLKMLEIGLGCRMKDGPGGSIPLWRSAFPGGQLHILEYDAACAQPYIAQVDKMWLGDQADSALLRRMVLETADSGVLYDLIVDDGGHSMKQQQASLEGLWDALKPGGVYIIEDLLTSYMSDLGGGYLRPQTTIEALKKMLDTLNQHMLPSDVKASLSAVQKSTQALLCWSELCALIKNP